MTPVLETCASLSTSSQYTGDKSEGSTLLHRFKTKVSSLLQSKLPEEKWIGLALAKAAMESSFECLASNGEVWVRLMVPILTVRLFLSFFLATVFPKIGAEAGADYKCRSLSHLQ